MTSRKTLAADTPQPASASNTAQPDPGSGGCTLSAFEIGILLSGIASEISNAVGLIEDDISDGHGTLRLRGAVALLCACGARADRFVVALNQSPHERQDNWLLAPLFLELLERIEGGKQ